MINTSESSINVNTRDEPNKLTGSGQNGTHRSTCLTIGLHGHTMCMAERRDLNQPCCNNETR
jgi:hypothetical protein